MFNASFTQPRFNAISEIYQDLSHLARIAQKMNIQTQLLIAMDNVSQNISNLVLVDLSDKSTYDACKDVRKIK